jgi:hypothetical protein
MIDIHGLQLKTRVDEILNRRPTVGLALGVVRNGSSAILGRRLRSAQRQHRTT